MNDNVTRPASNARRFAPLSKALPGNLFSLAVPAQAQTWTSIDCPGYPHADARGINDFGTIVGICEDQDENFTGYLLKGGVFSTVVPPGAWFTEPWDVNNLGVVVGDYI